MTDCGKTAGQLLSQPGNNRADCSSIGNPPDGSNEPKADMTASLIGNDRSRHEEAESGFHALCRRDSHFHDEMVKLAGPMKNWDPLYMLLIILAVVNCLCGVNAILLPYAFTIYRPHIDKSTTVGLFYSVSCSSVSSNDADSLLTCYGTSGNDGFGIWVLLMQVFAIIGLVLGAIFLLLQLINLCMNPRSRIMHNVALYIMAIAGFFMLMAGHLGHNRSVWARHKDTDEYVIVEPLSSALLLTCVVLSAWSCITSHVTQHAPGPLSSETRFLHTLVQEPPPKEHVELMPLPVCVEIEVPPPKKPSIVQVQEVEQPSFDLIHSTEV